MMASVLSCYDLVSFYNVLFLTSELSFYLVYATPDLLSNTLLIKLTVYLLFIYKYLIN